MELVVQQSAALVDVMELVAQQSAALVDVMELVVQQSASILTHRYMGVVSRVP